MDTKGTVNTPEPANGPVAPPYPGLYYNNYGTHVPATLAAPPPNRTKRTRFFRVFFLTLTAIFFFHILVIPHIKHMFGDRHSKFRDSYPTHDPRKGWPEPSDGVIDFCVSSEWSYQDNMGSSELFPYPYTGETSFTLPTSSSLLYLLSRGSYSSGAVTITTSSETDQDTVKVDIKVGYFTAQALDRANVCRLERRDDQHGIGIFTPRSWSGHSRSDQLHFDVLVTLPASAEKPLYLKAFETSFGLFEHDIDDLQGLVEFDSFYLRSSNMPIAVASLRAEHASLRTSNGPIQGKFNSSSSLELITSNARIEVDVSLVNDDKGKPTELNLRTSNGVIDADVSLSGPESSNSSGQFGVIARTSNSALDLKFPESSVSAILHASARTSNAPATVHLHPAYEGTFSLRSSIFTPTIEFHEDTEDPSGEGRKRKLDERKIGRGRVEGSVWWDQEKKEGKTGEVEVATSNSRASLIL